MNDSFIFSNNNVIFNNTFDNSTNTNTTLIENKCEMFGSFSYIIQFVLGVLSFMILIVKRFVEKPRRPWKIWFFDVSKQIVSALLAHLLNVILALILSFNNETDECVWYFINIFIDTTLGVFICFFLMKIINNYAREKKLKLIRSGLYYEFYYKNNKRRTKLNYNMYFAQLCIWVIVVTITKFFLLGVQKLFTKYLEVFGNTILSPFKDNGKLKLIIVMIFIPFILNAINFWLIDNILKLKADENDELKEIYSKETEENDKDFPCYINVNVENCNYDNKQVVNHSNQLELKLAENNTTFSRDKS